jgi:hypothetical protein
MRIRYDDSPRVKSSSSKAPPTGYPEFAVRRETISRYFEPPLPRSTFHDLVGKGSIVPMKGLRGFYRLNDSLRRLGLREVPSLPGSDTKRTTEDILQLALALIDPDVFPAPSWMLDVEVLEMRDADHARLLAEKHTEPINALATALEKIHYARGVMDAQAMMEKEAGDSGE